MKMKNPVREFKFLLQRGSPVYLLLEPTARCDSRCRHCFNWKRQDSADPSAELTLGEIERLSRSMRHVKYLSLTGGEPTLRDDLPQMCRTFARNNDLHVANLHTNGVNSKRTVEVFRGCMDACPDVHWRVCLPADDTGEAMDRMRGVPDCEGKLRETVRQLKELKKQFPGFSIEVTTTISQLNKRNFSRTCDFVESLDVDEHILALVRGTPRDPAVAGVGLEEYEEIVREFEDVRKGKTRRRGLKAAALAALQNMTTRESIKSLRNKRMTYPCRAGTRAVKVTSTGDVLACELIEEPMGNLRDFDFDLPALMKSEKAVNIIDSIKNNECYCSFECLIPVNMLFDPRAYPRLAAEVFRLR